jgi:hypothetical protein
MPKAAGASFATKIAATNIIRKDYETKEEGTMDTINEHRGFRLGQFVRITTEKAQAQWAIQMFAGDLVKLGREDENKKFVEIICSIYIIEDYDKKKMKE